MQQHTARAMLCVLACVGIVGLLTVQDSGGDADAGARVAVPTRAQVADLPLIVIYQPPDPSLELMQASWDADEAHAEAVAAEAEAARVAAEQAEVARLEVERRRVAAETPAPATPRQAPPPPTATASSVAPCGGDLPPCYVALRESGGNYGAFNPGGCSGTGCYGKWQFGGFWAGKLGLPVDIWNATPEQQDNAARILWNGGAGCSNWAAC